MMSSDAVILYIFVESMFDAGSLLLFAAVMMSVDVCRFH